MSKLPTVAASYNPNAITVPVKNIQRNASQDSIVTSNR